MSVRRGMIVGLLMVAFLVTGCRHHCWKRQGCCGPVQGPHGPGFAPPRGGVIESLPPQNIPIDPIPRSSERRNPEILLPEAIPQGGRNSNYSPMPKAPNARLGDPDFSGSTSVESESPLRSEKPDSSPPRASSDLSTALPVGIADFAIVKDGVASGLRPKLDGLDWLQAKKYRTVLYLKPPMENDSSDKKQTELRGLTYLTLTVSAESLTFETVEEFNRIVGSSQSQPLFVYDHNSSLAGAMWYLHFRSVDLLSDEQARIRAARYGFNPEGSSEQVRMAKAAEKLLASRP